VDKKWRWAMFISQFLEFSFSIMIASTPPLPPADFLTLLKFIFLERPLRNPNYID
jgi:hypothetical protein